MFRIAASRPAHSLAKALAHRAGVKDAPVRWRLETKPSFDNQISTMDWQGEWAELTLEKAVPGDAEKPRLEQVRATSLAGPPPRRAERSGAKGHAIR